jgi:hypothetical protein
VAKLRERISVRKRARQKFDLERFELRSHDDVEVKEKYQVEITKRFAALENLDESFDINSDWERKEYHRLKHNKPWFDDECSKLIHQRKMAKLQLFQNPSQINGDNRRNLRRETNKIFRNKERE